MALHNIADAMAVQQNLGGEVMMEEDPPVHQVVQEPGAEGGGDPVPGEGPADAGSSAGSGGALVLTSGSARALKRRRLPCDLGDQARPKPRHECAFATTAQEHADFFNIARTLYENRQLCDVTFVVGDQQFHAHKMFMAGHKTALGAMMTTDMREGQESVIELKDTDPQQFKMLLDYMYGKTITVASSEVINLLNLATRYQVAGLKAQVSGVLANGLDVDNCAAIFSAADLFACEDLKHQAFNKLVSHFACAACTEGFCALDERQVLQILSSDFILDCDESVVFDAAVRWLEFSADDRMPRKAQVMATVRFPLMDAGLLSDVIKPHPLLQDPECLRLLLEAWEHKCLVAAGRVGVPDSPRIKPRRRSCSFMNHTLLNGHSDAVSALTVANGKLVSGSWDTTIKVWEPSTWQCLRTLSDHTGTIRCFTVCGGRLVSGSDDCSIKVWNPDTWTLVRTLTDHSDVVNAITECNGRLVSGSDDGTIKLWNSNTWQCLVTIHQEDHACGVLALTMCGDKLASGSDEGVIKIWSTQNWTCEQVIRDHGDEIWALCCVGDTLVSGSIDSTIRVWDTESWACLKVLEDHTGAVYALAVLDGKLVSASSDETIRVWDDLWECERTLQCSGVWALTVYSDRLVSGSLDNAVKVWV